VRLTKIIPALALSLAMVLAVAGTGDAHTCTSTCNQVRRVCRLDAKIDRKAAYAACNAASVECHDGCAATAASCAEGCAADDAECAAGCEADAALCSEGCETSLDTCRGDADLARADAFELCNAERGECRGLCDDASDQSCIRPCARAAGACFQEGRKALRDCRVGCTESDTPAACRRDCNAAAIDSYHACITGFGACANACIPTTTTSTTSTTLPLP
jgi:hypothetical protein